MVHYAHVGLRDPFIHQNATCKLQSLERRCSIRMERLKTAVAAHFQHGLPWEKAVSFFTMRKVLILHNGYSRCSRDLLRLSPNSVDDVAPLF